MADRFWLRHPSLRQDVGLYSLDQLRSAIEAGAFPVDSQVRREDGEDWQAATVVLGMPAALPPRSTTAAPATPQAPSGSPPPLARVREATAYASFRTIVTIVAIAGMVIALVTMIIALDALSAVNGPGSAALLAITGCILHILIILVVAKALHILADLGDCALRRDSAS